MIGKTNQSTGFIKFLLLVIIVVALLAYFKIDLRQFIDTYGSGIINWLKGIFN